MTPRVIPQLVAGALALLSMNLVHADSVPAAALKQYGKTVTLTKPIVVPSGKTFDGKLPNGKWTRYVADKKRMGDGSQRENQKPLFILRPGAKLQHIILDKPSADGIHAYTSDGKTTRIRYVQVRDVGEDAITVCSGDHDGQVLIERCSFLKATDKVIQVNAPARVTIKDCYAQNFERFCRTNGGGPNYKYRVTIHNLRARNGGTVLKMTNSQARGTLSKVQCANVDHYRETSNGAEIYMKTLRFASNSSVASEVQEEKKRKFPLPPPPPFKKLFGKKD